MLRALTHPMRQRIMWELGARGHARAADLADIIGEPANSLSFHLRVLAKAGLIEESPEHARDARDRVWRMTHPGGLNLPGEAAGGGAIAADPFAAERLDWLRGMLDESIPQEPNTTRAIYLGAAMLTRDESRRMAEEVIQVMERWRQHGIDRLSESQDDPDRVFHFTAAFVGNPRPTDAVPSAEPRASVDEPSDRQA
ncbi:helix-turn-helix transcriptional regulator [Planctomonas sp. JC2975]|nr:helix-turn-helix domain-containing protein [Planctomonas sp. JC2975]NNC11446.1 helix-turn-helix transcriptional regulator [Planctomonas sp. JC2975]